MPVMSEQNYKVYVSAFYSGLRDDKSLPTSNFKILLKALSTYRSDACTGIDGAREIKKSETERCFLFPSHSLTSDDGNPSSPSWNYVSNMITDMEIDFSLDRLQWRANPLEDWISLEKQEDVVRNILHLARRKASENFTRDQPNKQISLLVSIKKEITVPHRELEVLANARKSKQEVEQIQEAISWAYRQPLSARIRYLREIEAQLDGTRYSLLIWRAIQESAEQTEAKLIPAAESAIVELEDVIVDVENSRGTSCAICMEKMGIGSTVKRMPCSHNFHKTCILNWLNTSHICPLCRFKLPTN